MLQFEAGPATKLDEDQCGERMVDVARRQAQYQGGGRRRSPIWVVVAAVVAVAALVGGILVYLDDDGAVEPQASGVVFEDQFDELSDEKWLVADYPVDVNDEKAYYTPENVTTRDGMLVITAEDRELGGRDYASGLLSTAGRFSFTYGKVEWRAKMAKGKGIWPSLWLNGQDCAETFQSGSQRCDTWPEPGSDELDVVEIGGSEPNLVHMTQHYAEAGEDYEGNPPNECEWEGPDMSADFHTYGLEWTPDALVWFVDGVERCRATEPIPDTPKFLIMNMAVGGHFDGDPDHDTEFPVEYQIDWVRVTDAGQS
jgi:beta-glucanase (GH16 family)